MKEELNDVFERFEKAYGKDKKLRVLKAQRTKLLNKQCETMEQFEKVQDRLNEVDLQMKLIMEDK